MPPRAPMSRSEGGDAAAPNAMLLSVAPALFVLLWSTGFIGAKLGLPHAPPLAFLSVRYLAVATLLTLVAFATRAAWPAGRREWGHLAVAGLLVQATYLGGVFVAISLGLSAGVTALIVGMQPVLTAIVAGRLLGEHLDRRQWLGVAVGFGGVVLVVSSKLGHGTLSTGGLLCAVVALVGITAGTLYQKRFVPRVDLRTGGAIQFAASLLVTFPLALLLETRPIVWTGEFLFALAWLVIVLSLGAMFLLFTMLRYGAASRVASLMYLTPGVTAVFAFLLFDERLPVSALIGLCVTAVGVYLVIRRPQ
jgi:drug/metabolite transporter (DMT)-like permease